MKLHLSICKLLLCSSPIFWISCISHNPIDFQYLHPDLLSISMLPLYNWIAVGWLSPFLWPWRGAPHGRNYICAAWFCTLASKTHTIRSGLTMLGCKLPDWKTIFPIYLCQCHHIWCIYIYAMVHSDSILSFLSALESISSWLRAKPFFLSVSVSCSLTMTIEGGLGWVLQLTEPCKEIKKT